MRTESVHALIKAVQPLLPSESPERLTDIMLQTNNRRGEFTAALRPSDALTLKQTWERLRVELEEAQLQGL